MQAALTVWQPALNDARDSMGGARVRVQFVDRLPAFRYDFDPPDKLRKCLGRVRPDGAGYLIELLAELDEELGTEIFAHELAHVVLGHLSRLRAGEPERLHEAEAKRDGPAIMKRYGLW
jgi:hypothetical protein